MISIPITEVKLFMNHLLCRSTFDAFCVPELSLSTFASFHMDGHILKDYYTKEEYETLYKDRTPIARWKQLRPVCYPGFESRLTGAEVLAVPVVTDGHITTSRGMGTAIAFALELTKRLKDEETAKQVGRSIIYNV